VAELAGRGDLDGSSFGFVVTGERWEESESEDGRWMAIRTVESVRLLDVSPVTYPAYASTTAGMSGRQRSRSTAPARGGQLPLAVRLALVRARAVQVEQDLRR
jgi:phage head maturation protease